MLIVAGLGNPGTLYEKNRHNIGFMAIDAIYQRNSFSPWSKKFQSVISDGMIEGIKIFLAKPQTWMNCSGQAIGEIMRFYKMPVDRLIVIHDELDLLPGKVRVRKGGGTSGHNGIKSVNSHCGKDYRRVRIGIGHPGSRELVHSYVLGDFAKEDEKWLDVCLADISKYVNLLVRGSDNAFMNNLSGNCKQQDKPKNHIGKICHAPDDQQETGISR